MRILLLVLLLTAPALAQGPPGSSPPKPAKKKPAGKKPKAGPVSPKAVVKGKAKRAVSKAVTRRDPGPTSRPLAVVRPRARLTKRIVLVVDTSGSMQIGDRIARAVDVVLRVLTQPTDDLQVSIVAFSNTPSRWKGVAEKGVPEGWARFPSVPAKRAALAWLRSFPADGLTCPGPALAAALSEPRRHVSVVLVSDGRFDEAPVLKLLKAGQEWRRKRKLGRAPVMAYGVGEDARDQEAMRKLGKAGGGGFLVEPKPAPKPAPSRARTGPW